MAGHGPDCTCTSCVSHSSEHLSPRHLDRSKIEKLYSRKHIPAREKKLLDKLVKARAAYDDLRTEIISGSNNSIHGRADLRPNKKRGGQEDDEIERSSAQAILKLVDIVDRGGSTKDLSDCCSCCLCKPGESHARDMKAHRHSYYYHSHRRQAHRGGGGHVLSKTSREMYRTTGGPRLRRPVHFIARSIRSVPCTCTYELLKRKSQAMIKRMKMRPENAAMESYARIEDNTFEKHGARTAKGLVKKSVQKFKTSKSRIKHSLAKKVRTSVIKAKQSKLLLGEKIQAGAKHSLEKLKATKRNIKTKADHARKSIQSNLQGGARNSIEKYKTTQKKIRRTVADIKESLQTVALPKLRPKEKNISKNMRERMLSLKNDSITKFREKNQLLEEMNEWACEHECYPKECVPEDCLKLLLKNRERRAKHREISAGTNRIRQHKRRVGQSSTESNINVQVQENTTSARVGTRKIEVTQLKEQSDKTEPDITINVSAQNKQERTKVSCECLDTETRKKSKGNLTLADRKLTQVTPTGVFIKKEKQNQNRPSKASLISSRQHYATQLDTKPQTTVSDSSVNRQAVRISSSFSFSIEFYKNKPSAIPRTELKQDAAVLQASDQSLKEYAIKERNKGYHSKKPTQRTTETRMRKQKKDSHAGGHALKRCICNLKLKSKKKKKQIIKSTTKGNRAPKNLKGLTRHSTESVQTMTSLLYQKALRPNECEPDVCVPGECDPFECYELIKKRLGGKHSSAHTNTNTRKGTRSVSSFTKSTSSRSSKPVQVYSPSKTKETQQTSQITPFQVKPVIHSHTQQRQAVHIGSSFSFNMEFYKDKPVKDNSERIITTYSKEHSRSDIKPESKIRQRDKEEKERYVRHRHSQKRMSVGKSKYTATKHSLRRCFCTLKLKPGKGNAKPQSTSKIFVNSKSTITQTLKVRSKRLKLHYQHPNLSQHECEPGICIPGECNPYKCLKILNKREGTRVKRHDKYSDTENSRTRSSSNFTTQSIVSSRAKKMQSNILTYKTEVPPRKYKEKAIKSKMPKEINSLPSSSNRQAVRIGSSFSFDIEFYKDRTSPVSNERINYVSSPRKLINVNRKEALPTHNEHYSNLIPPRTIDRKKNISRERDSQGDIKQDQVSVQVQVKKFNKNARIESIINRCFCALNFNKNKHRSKVKCLCKENITIGTETSKIKEPTYRAQMTKSTKTKQNKHYLKPHECEPYACIPGECDPYKCLERIRRRQHLKEFGTSTEHVKKRPGSSLTQNISVSSGIGTVKARSRQQKTSTKVYKTRKYSTSPHHVKIDPDSRRNPRQPVKKSNASISKMNSRQSVRIGSSFSFDIEFYKDRRQLTERTLIEKSSKANEIKRTRIESSKGKKVKRANSRTVRHRNDIKVPAKEISIRHQETEAENGKKKHKATGIKPILKRCFCTLQLRKKEKINQNYNTHKTSTIPTQVYTVSRVTVSKVAVAETKITTLGEKYESKNSRYRSKKVIETEKAQMLSDSIVKYNFNKHKLQFKKLRHFKKQISKSSQLNNNVSKLNIDVKFSKDVNTIYNIHNVENVIRNTSSSTVCEGLVQQFTKKISNESPGDCFSNLNVRQCPVSGVNSFLSRRYCIMNVNTGAKQYKLKPYECEPGVCVPNECDPYECQKLINRRLRASKLSGTDPTSRSTSSYSNLTPSQRARKLQSKNQLRSAKRTHVREPVSGINYKAIPNRPQKQMVRVGSSFSFDIQFSKDRSPVTPTYRELIEPKLKYHSDRSVKTVNRKTKGTRGMKATRHNRDSQSGMTMVDRGASVSPRLKRCFCTLKLHKKGKQQHVHQSSSQGTMTSQQRRKEAPKAVTATTGQNTRGKKLRTLDPNECEPGVCTPGECNPYDCLELIKRRNKKYRSRGFSTVSTGSRSASSGSGSKRRRGQRVQSDLRGRRNHGSVAAIRDVAKRGYTQSTKHLPPNRQMVRIGSTFSFNIEFYKDRTPHTDRIQAAAKVIKTRRKNVKTKRIPRSSSRGSVSRSIGQHSRDSQAGIKTGDQGSDAAPRLKRCFCTLKLQKQGQRPLQPKQVRLVNQSTKTRSYQPTPTLHDRSVMASRKLKPYECEPGVCIPGECDPHECDKLIQNRLRREFGTSTGRNKTRSAVSSTSATTSRGRKVQYAGRQHRTRNRPIQSRNMIVKPVREKILLNTISDRPSRQAVKIGSSFSFNIEFFKDKGGNAVTNSKSPEYIRKVTPSRVKQPKVKKRAGYSQDQRSIRSTDSQIGHNMRSAGTGIKPMLKRCFCTLSLNKPKRRPVPEKNMLDAGTETHNIANKPMPKFTRTAANRTKQVYHLKSYECEPGICVPGVCDPYECLRRIKKREMRSRMAGTYTPRGRSISSFTSTSGRASQTQSRSPKYRHQTTGHRDRYLVEDRRFKSIENPFRQAVRISSSFSFNIEFYKDRLSELAEMHNSPDEGRHRKRERQDGTESRRIENKGVCTDETCLRNRPSQSQGTKADSRGTGVGPMLKRCFCTLKLQKIGKNQQYRIPDQYDATTSTPRHYRQYKPRNESVSIGVGTKRRAYDLKPYECEPNVCVPGECDPHECLERINRRKMRSSNIGTDNLHGYNRSTATLIQKSAKCRDTQCYRDPNSKCRSTQCYLKRQNMKGFSKTEPRHRQRYSPSSNNSHRQCIRLGSNFSFDIEFFKDRKTHEASRKKVIYNDVPTTTPSMKVKKYTNRGSHGQNSLRHRTSQMIGAATESRGSGMPLLKRCFCTLKLRKGPHGIVRNDTKTVNFVSLDVKPPPLTSIAQTCNKISAIKTECIARNTFNSYSCNPQICIPGKTERLVSLKKFVKKRKCNYPTARTHTEQVYFCNMLKNCASTCNSGKVQLLAKNANELDSKTIKKLHLINNLCGRYSTVSHQLENYIKLQRHPKTLKEKSKSKKADVSSDRNKSPISRSNYLKIKNKSEGKILQRFSRTLKLQTIRKKNLQLIESYPKNKLSFKKTSVQNDVKISSLYYSKRRKNNLLPDYGPKAKANKDSQKSTSPCKIHTENEKMCNINHNEMETIFPYIPNKFNKSISKTVFFQNNVSMKTVSVPLDTNDVNMVSEKNVRNHDEQSHKQETCSSPKNKFSIKKIIRKCTQLFKKSPYTKPNMMSNNGHLSEHVSFEPKVGKTTKDKSSKHEKFSKTDILKSSRSDRRPEHSKSISHSIPKKSRSLKIAKAPEKFRYHKKYANYINEGTKKYSRFQSGDAGLGYIKPVKAYLKKQPFDTYNINNNFHCSYCQVLYDKDKEYLRNKEIPYMNQKVVQLTLVSPKNNKLQKRKHKQRQNLPDECIEEFCATTDVNECPCAKRIRGKTPIENKTSSPKGILKNGANIKKPEDNKKPKQEIEETNNQLPSNQSPFKDPPSKQSSAKQKKLVCKTKKPCVCCSGARKKAEPGQENLAPTKLISKTLKKDKCKVTCLTETEEEAGKSVCIKMLEKYIPKFSLHDYIPDHDDKCVYDPMFSMKMDSNSMAILNRDEIYEKVTKLKSDKKADYDSLKPEELKLLHGKSCSCCICQSMKHRKPQEQPKVVSVASIATKASQFGRKLGIGKEPCICGSAPCAAEVKRIADKAAEKKRRKKKKPCVCGTKICEKESLKLDIQNHIVSKKGGKKLKKIIKQKSRNKKIEHEKLKRQEKAKKEWHLRQLKYKKEDELRRKKRKREDKIMNKQVKKYKNTSGWLLAAESILDIGQLLYKSTTGILRFTGRAVMDPKRTTRYFQDAKKDPSRILTNLKHAWSDSGVHSTAKRVGMRVGAMPCWARLKACLEQHAVTHYLVHMCDKNPKARLARKKRLVRRREPMDFECSLYMASLRKKPWLGVYYKFQWFYPHCVSMLHILRSVADVLLFLLAVVVWSPCLCCLELCRALMCCTLCTG